MSLLPRTESSLVRRALASDARAFEALVLRHQKRAHAIARAVGLRGGAVDDAVQEAFLAAFRGLGGLRQPARFGPWLVGIVRRVACKRLAAEDRAPVPLPADDARLAAPDPVLADGLEQRELSDLLWRQVSALPGSLREVVYLYYHEGESVRAVGAALGISREAVKSRLKRGREILREELWRQLRQGMHRLVSGERDWSRRGRRLTLLAIAATGPAREAAASLAPAVFPASGAASTATWAIVAGGIMACAKKGALAAASAIIVLCGSGAIVLAWRTGQEVAAPPVGAVPAGRPTPELARALPLDPAAHSPAGRVALPEPPAALLELRDLRTDESIDAARAELVLDPPEAANAAMQDGKIAVRFAGDDTAATLTVRVRGYAEASVEIEPAAAGAPGSILLDPGLCIVGKVVEARGDAAQEPDPADGAPIAAAIVRALRVSSAAHQTLEEASVSEARTDAAGAFRVTGLTPGERIVIHAAAPGRADRYVEVPLPTAADVGDVTLELERGFTLRGSVEAADPDLDDLLTRVKVITRARKVHGVGNWPESLAAERTLELARDEGGGASGLSFELRGLPAGEYRLNVEPTNDAFAMDNWSQPLELAVGNALAEVSLVAGSARTITGTVVTSEGKPFAGALACLMEPGGDGSVCCDQSRDNGTFELKRALRGKAYRLFVLAPHAARRDYDLARDGDVYILDPDSAGALLRVKVAFHGQDISQGRLFFTCFDHPDSPDRYAGGMFIPAQHPFRPEGYRKLVLYGRSGETDFAPRLIDLASREAADIDLQMEEGATLRGRLVADAGEALQGATVRVTTEELKRWQSTARSGADGAFELRGLPLDPTSLRVEIEDAGGWHPRDELRVASYDLPATFVLTRAAGVPPARP